MANIYNEPDSTNVKITLKNNVYSYLNTNIGIAKICLITDQKKFGYSDLLGNLKKCLTDASGSSVTPENCVFIADSEGSASHSTTFVYNDNKLGVNIATPQNRAHFHEPSTGNCLIQITNSIGGSVGDSDGMTLGIVGDNRVIRTTYGFPVKIQVEDNANPGTFVDLATFQDIGGIPNTILDTDLTVSIIPAKSEAASVFLTHEENTIKTRTAAQVLDDIGAAAVNHTHGAIDLPANIVYTNNAQTITGAKTFSQNTTFGGAIIGSNVNGLSITTNTVDGSDNKYVSLFGAGGNANRAAGLVAYGNENSEGQGDLRLYAGSSGAIRLYGNTILSGNTAFGKNTFVGGYRVEVEGNALVSGTLKANDFGDDWVDYNPSVNGVVFDLIKKVKYKKTGKRVDVLYSFKKSSTALSVGSSFTFSSGQISSGFDDTFYNGICTDSNGEQVGAVHTMPIEGVGHFLNVVITKTTNELYGSLTFYTV